MFFRNGEKIKGEKVKIRKVVNLFGGPCTGKSLISAELFTKLKKMSLKVEMAHEYAKELTYEDRQKVLQDDQLYIFAKQHRKLFRLKDVVEVAISDSPLILPIIYLHLNGESIYDSNDFTQLVKGTFDKYPNLNILLKRNPKFPFEKYGRNQTEAEAKLIDNDIKQFLNLHGVPYVELISDDATVDAIISLLV